MANYSTCEFNLWGSKEQIKLANVELVFILMSNEWLNCSLVLPGTHGLLVECFEVEDERIFICGTGRWAGCHEYFIDLCKRYKLSGKYIDYETGCDFFVATEIEDGEVIVDQSAPFISELTIAYYGEEFLINECIGIFEFDITLKQLQEEYYDVTQKFASVGIDLIKIFKEKYGESKN